MVRGGRYGVGEERVVGRVTASVDPERGVGRAEVGEARERDCWERKGERSQGQGGGG